MQPTSFIKIKKYTLTITLSLCTSILLFTLTKPYVVNALVGKELDITYDVDTKEDEKGFSQIVLKDSNGEVTFLTESNFPNANPKIAGDTVTWMGQDGSKWQIYKYNLKTKKTLKLTTEGNNVNPQIDGEILVWEGNVEGTWQVYYFDGLKIKKLTLGDNPKQDVTISNGEIAYSQKDVLGWNVYIHNIKANETIKLTESDNNRNPEINGEVVLWDYSNDNEYGYKKYDKTNNRVEKFIGKSGLSFEQQNDNLTNLGETRAQNTKEDIEKELGIVPEDPVEIIDLTDIEETTESVENTPEVEQTTESID